MQNTYTTVGCNVYNFDVALLTGVSVANTALTPHNTITKGVKNMTQKCEFYESNPTQECRLTKDVCELAHCDSHNYRKDCFTYSMRVLYPNHKRETRVSARARSLA